jgi:short-subunit dehydrogenase
MGRTPTANLRGATVLITGAAGALGTATARELARRGVKLALADRDAAGLDRLAGELRAQGTTVATFPVDMLDDAQLAALPDQVERDLSPVDIFISGAGLEINACLHTVTTEEIDVQLGLHLRSPMLLSAALVPRMRERGRGHIMIISSMSGKIPQPAKAPYAAAKAGSIAFTHALRRELAGTGVTASVVAPGVVTGAGQAHRAMEGSSADPTKVGGVTVEQCVEAILDALTHRRAEITVTGKPTGALSALQAAWPSAADWVLKRTGVGDFWLNVAKENGRC